MIPYLLFAYREVPQASTVFSLFELLCGRDVRGPLDIFERRLGISDENVITELCSVNEGEAQPHVGSCARKFNQHQKTWYDKRARLRAEINIQRDWKRSQSTPINADKAIMIQVQ